MWLKKQIPNFITLLNLFCGCIAVIFAVIGRLELAAFLVMLGIFFDFFDGLAARLLNAQSELGLQLDSLADMVTSGVVPGIILFQLFEKSALPVSIAAYSWSSASIVSDLDFSILSFAGLAVTLASAYRLAKFNIDDRQISSFIGLPTPANTLLIISLPLILTSNAPTWIIHMILHPGFLLFLTALSCYLLNAEIPLFALKFKTWDFKSNTLRYLFLIGSLTLLLFLNVVAIPVIILLYVVLSLVFKPKPFEK